MTENGEKEFDALIYTSNKVDNILKVYKERLNPLDDE